MYGWLFMLTTTPLQTSFMRKIFTFLLMLSGYFAGAQSTTLVISQVYGAGGNASATYNADFVELHNVSSTPQSLNGLSVQYASATNTSTWTGVFALPAVVIPPGGYYLIQMSSVGTNGVALPTPDAIATPTIAMAAANGKVALVNGITAVGGCPDPLMIDLVGYGTANCSETSPTAALSAANSAIRNNNGCTDTDNNGNDFTVEPVAPRNSATPANTCSAVPPDPQLTAAPTSLSFGTVTVGTNSAAQTFDLSGTDLTGAPGNITITASSTDFQVSSDNTNWGATATVAYTSGTLTATTVYVRFTPQSTGAINGTASITGGGVTTAVTVTLNGTGIAAGTPNISAGSITSFGDVCINQTIGPVTFDINGTNLTTADVTVGPLSGFTFATSSAGPFSNTLSITQPGGTFNQTVYVNFLPTAVQSYSGDISISGGGIATPVLVAASGAGVNNVPGLTTGNASSITTNSAVVAGTINSNGCSAVTTYGFEYSTTPGFTTGTVVNATNLAGGDFSAPINGLAPSTTYYYKAFATNAGGTGYGLEQSFTTAAPPPPGLAHTTLADFGDVCVNTTAGPNVFTLTGFNLTNDAINVGPLDGFTFADNAAGPFTATVSFAPTAGGFSGDVFVNFTPETAGSFNGNIPVTGGGITGTYNVPVTGNGDATGAQVSTTDSLVLSHHEAVLSGQITALGCSPVTSYGIEYSSIQNFILGTGTRVPSGNLNTTTGEFSSTPDNLIQNTRYYFRAYTISSGIATYGDERSFTTSPLPAGVVIYGIPVKRGNVLHYSLTNMEPGHYSIRLINSLGQVAFQRDIILQLNFIDDRFVVPSVLGPGAYTMQIINTKFRYEKQILILQ